MDKLLSVPQAAEFLGYTPSYVRTLAKQGKLKGYKRGQSWFFKKEDLDNMFTLVVDIETKENGGLDI